jgi:hypothetical protein
MDEHNNEDIFREHVHLITTAAAGVTFERVHSVRINQDGSAQAAFNWLPKGAANACASVIPGARIGQPIDMPIVHSSAPAFQLIAPDESAPDEIYILGEAIANANAYAEYLSKYNLYGFKVVVDDSLPTCARVDIFDHAGTALGYIGEPTYIRPDIRGGNPDQRKVIDNLLSKAVYLQQRGASFMVAVEEAAAAQWWDDYDASGNLAHDPMVVESRLADSSRL